MITQNINIFCFFVWISTWLLSFEATLNASWPKAEIETIINIGEDYEHFNLYETISADNVTTKNNIIFSLDANKKIYVEVILNYTYTTIIEGEATQNTQSVKTYLEVQLDLNNNILESDEYKLKALDGMVGEATLKLTFDTFKVEQEVEE